MKRSQIVRAGQREPEAARPVIAPVWAETSFFPLEAHPVMKTGQRRCVRCGRAGFMLYEFPYVSMPEKKHMIVSKAPRKNWQIQESSIFGIKRCQLRKIVQNSALL
jgi:hypothetical protein